MLGLEKTGAPPDVVQQFQDSGMNQLKTYFQADGEILFGTDVGYTDYDPSEEYQQMNRASMNFPDILAALTTAPAKRFGVPDRKGKISIGMDADMVLLAGAPANDITALSNVRYTLRKGRIVYHMK